VLIDRFGPLVAGEERLSLEVFWAEDDEPDPAWFGSDEADADAAYEALADQGTRTRAAPDPVS
jgi:hypothetical protein